MLLLLFLLLFVFYSYFLYACKLQYKQWIQKLQRIRHVIEHRIKKATFSHTHSYRKNLENFAGIAKTKKQKSPNKLTINKQRKERNTLQAEWSIYERYKKWEGVGLNCVCTCNPKVRKTLIFLLQAYKICYWWLLLCEKRSMCLPYSIPI